MFIIVKVYDHEQTPQKLHFVDSLTVAFVDEQIDATTYSQQISGYFQFGGHPNGYYMANLILDNLGVDTLINTFSDPLEFLKIYNGVSKDLEGEHVFSDAFLAFVETLIVEQLSSSDYTDEVFDVTFTVDVPNEDDAVYITGNQSALGDWDPAKVQLEKIAPNKRQITLPLQAPVEFKFTRGNWNTEGYVKGQMRGPNLQLGFTSDTLFVYEVEEWADQVQ